MTSGAPEIKARRRAPVAGADGDRLAHIVVQDVRPSTPHGYPAKAVVGERVPVRASIFRDGHDVLAARAVLRRGTKVEDVCPLDDVGNDVWSGTVTSAEVGAHELVVEAWTDRYSTWAHRAAVELAARQDVHNEIAEAVALLSEWAPANGAPANGALANGALADGPPGDAGSVAQALGALTDAGADDASRINPALSASVARALAGPSLATDLTAAAPAPIWVDRERAGYGAWYELFPRSFGGLRGTAAQSHDWPNWVSTLSTCPPFIPSVTPSARGKIMPWLRPRTTPAVPGPSAQNPAVTRLSIRSSATSTTSSTWSGRRLTMGWRSLSTTP